MSVPLKDIGADSIDELIALVGDDSKLGSAVLDPLRELVWRQAAKDFPWFLENFWHVLTVSKGYQLMKLRDYQASEAKLMGIVAEVERAREIRLKARQIGWTTLASGFAFHTSYFYEYRPWMISSQGEDEAKGTLLSKIKTPYLMLPRWMRERGPKKLDDNKEQLTWDNGSWLMSIPSTSSAGRSQSVYGALVDEWAFVESAEELVTALDPLCYGPMFIFSTANGMLNPFNKTWVESTRLDSEWNRFSRVHRPNEKWHGTFVPWHAVPGRDQKWYEREKRKYRGREWAFYQEYPSTPEEAFAKTGRTALSMDLLRAQDIVEPRARIDLSLCDVSPTGDEPPAQATIPADESRDLELWVWEWPTIERDEHGFLLRKPNYVVGCDVAEGLDHGDRTSIIVSNANTLETVASFRGHVPVQDLGELLEWIGYWYHTALIGVERNNHGILPLDYLRRAAYPRLYRMQAFANQKAGRTPRFGWHTNKASKPKMINDFQKGLADDAISLHDTRLLEEAQTFVADGKGGYGATSGSHDDHVIGHLIAHQLMLDVGQYPIVWSDEDGPTTFRQVLDLAGHAATQRSGLDTGIGQDSDDANVVTSFFL